MWRVCVCHGCYVREFESNRRASRSPSVTSFIYCCQGGQNEHKTPGRVSDEENNVLWSRSEEVDDRTAYFGAYFQDIGTITFGI